MRCANPFGSRPLIAIRGGASGDLTLKDGETSNAGIAWSRQQGGPAISSPLLYLGYLYILEQNGGFLSCYEAKTGKQVYKADVAKGYHWANMLAADGKIYATSQDGVTDVVQAGKEFKLLGRNKLDELFWSSPAVARGALFLRGVDHLYCVRE